MENRRYRPSNGSEGDHFISFYCENCIHEKYIHTMDEHDKQCDILIRSMFYDVADEEYPDEWTYTDQNVPVCTKFKAYNWTDDDGNIIEPPYETEDPNQLTLL